MTAVLAFYLVLGVALMTLFDALCFPRDGSEASQRRFHASVLYPLQAAIVVIYVAFAVFMVGAAAAWPWVLCLLVLMAFAVHDLAYWLWRLALGLSSWRDWRPFGSWAYAKPTNLGWLLHASIAEGEWPWEILRDPPTAPKWLDTSWRLVGLALALSILAAYA